MPDLANDFKNYVTDLSSQAEKEQITALIEESRVEDSNRAKSILNAERWFKKRFGVRPQSVTWPWRGASNLHLPLTDKTMRRSKPNFANLIGATYPTCILDSNVLGDDQVIVRGIERHFNDVLLDEEKMNIFPPICLGIDMMLEKGRAIVKTIQEFTPVEKREKIDLNKLPKELMDFFTNPSTTDDQLAQELVLRYDLDMENEDDHKQVNSAIKQFRDGNDVIEFKRVINLTPHPSIFVRDPMNVLFPSDTPYMISQARWIRDRFPMTINDMEARVNSGAWDKKNGLELISRLKTGDRYTNFAAQEVPSGEGSNLKILEQVREGVSPGPNKTPMIDEFYIFKKMPGDVLARRMVLTIHSLHPDLPLKLIDYPYVRPDGRPEDWCFDQIQYELVNERAMAPRGYPQLLDSLQTEITNNHNAKQNWMTIANSLNLKCKRNANVTTNWVPGQPLWLNRMDDAQELNIAQRDMSFDNEERILKSWAEEYIGILDGAVTNQTGSPERRTKTEIDAITSIQVQVASLDVRIFQSCMQRIYRRVWNRYMQFGPDEITFSGPNGEVKSIPKSDIANRLSPRPAGNINSTNRQAKAGRGMALAQTLMPLPFVRKFEMVQDVLSLEDERWAERWLEKPEQVQQHQVERFIRDIMMINEGYTVVPRPDDDDQIALTVIDDYVKDPVKARNFKPDRLEALKNYRDAHQLALQKKSQATTRGGRMEQEVANVAQGQPKQGEPQ